MLCRATSMLETPLAPTKKRRPDAEADTVVLSKDTPDTWWTDNRRSSLVSRYDHKTLLDEEILALNESAAKDMPDAMWVPFAGPTIEAETERITAATPAVLGLSLPRDELSVFALHDMLNWVVKNAPYVREVHLLAPAEVCAHKHFYQACFGPISRLAAKTPDLTLVIRVVETENSAAFMDVVCNRVDAYVRAARSVETFTAYVHAEHDAVRLSQEEHRDAKRARLH